MADTKPDFGKMNLKELTEWHNKNCEAINVKPVKKFASTQAALVRCEDVYELLQEQPKKKTKAPKTKEETAKAIAAGTKASWENEEVRNKRKERHAVLIQVPGEDDATAYRSVKAVFQKFELPLGKHIPFRQKLKAEGTLEEFGFKWTSIPYTEYQEMLKAERQKPEAERNIENE